MSYLRKLRRTVKRSLDIEDDETVNKFVQEYVNRNSRDQRLYDLALCQTMLAFAAYQRIYEKHGKRKIEEAVANFATLIKELKRDGTTFNDMRDKLKEEAHYDFWQQMETLGLMEKFATAIKELRGEEKLFEKGRI